VGRVDLLLPPQVDPAELRKQPVQLVRGEGFEDRVALVSIGIDDATFSIRCAFVPDAGGGTSLTVDRCGGR
jgi:hypothetical protein